MELQQETEWRVVDSGMGQSESSWDDDGPIRMILSDWAKEFAANDNCGNKYRDTMFPVLFSVK